jgi:hypothetical protein
MEIRGLEQYRAFCQMAHNELTEVRIVIPSFEEETEPIGWVPPSVRKLTIYAACVVPIEIPDTVVEVVIEHYQGEWLDLPDTVRKLTLSSDFDAAIGHWPENLEELRIEGWCAGPYAIDWLPYTLKRVTLNVDVDIVVTEWPESLEVVVLEGEMSGLEQMWWPHAQLPGWVRVEYNEL